MKKLIPAFALLLVSAVVMSTASFAWFSMNTQVTAGNMEIKATTGENLLISSDASNWQTSITAATNIGAGETVLPVAININPSTHAYTFEANIGTDKTDGTAAEATNATLTVGNMTAGSSGTIALTADPTNANIKKLYKTGEAIAIYNSAYIATEEGTNAYTLTAKFTSPSITSGSIYTGVKAAVIIDGKAYDLGTAATGATSTPVTIADSIGSKTTPTTVFMVLYIDGAATNTTTQKALDMLTASGSFSFTFDAVAKA